MPNRLFHFLILLLTALPCAAQDAPRRLRLVEHNLENLFDTLHDESKEDLDFTPQGKFQWNSSRYWGKLGRLARLYAAVGELTPPDLIALCEVENDSVLHDLTRRTYLARLGYEYVCTASSDVRGIDVALLYQPLTFLPVNIDTICVRLPAGKRPTRDILHVAGILTSGDTLDVFVCHFPSRNGGRRATQPMREIAARTLKQAHDSLLAVRNRPYIICTGDFNDESRNRPLQRTLGADFAPDKPERAEVNKLYELRPESGRPDISGTYSWQGSWYELDHIFVSGSFLKEQATIRCKPNCEIICYPFLIEETIEGRDPVPYRTFRGPIYRGGTSDHLPLRADFWY